MKLILILILSLFAQFIYAQVEEIIHTDSSIISINQYPSGKEIKEKLFEKNILYYKFYYKKTDILISTGTCDTLERRIGLWKRFDNNGQLLITYNYDIRTWSPVQTEKFPYKSILDKMKLKGDSLIISNYGIDFFNKYIKWNFDRSALYGDQKDPFSESWVEPFNKRPDNFLLRYDIIYEDGHLYDGIIKFNLDRNGEIFLKFNLYDEIEGFELVSNKPNFLLTESEAVEKAKKEGLIETDTTKAMGFLKWEYFKEKESKQFNGQFRYYVIINTNTISDIKPEGRSRIENKFDVYVFNPWSGEFIEKKKMKSYKEWEKLGGLTTELLPDE